MKSSEHERRAWIIIALILLIGFLSLILAGGWAMRFSPSWQLNADMQSNLDPNSDFLTRRPNGFVEPVDASILTLPAWMDLFLTPGAIFSTGTPFPAATGTADPTQTVSPDLPASVVVTAGITASPTNTLLPLPSISSATSKAKNKNNPVPPRTSGPTATSAPTKTVTPSGTFTATPTPTITSTADLNEPDFGGPDGNAVTLGNGMSIEFSLSGFLVDGNSTWDVVYYEKEEGSSSGKVHLGIVSIEVYDQTTSVWYTVYYWGDGIPDSNASYNNGNSEPDDFPVDKNLLFGTPPLNTGIAIDIDTAVVAQGASIGDSITKLRITSRSNTQCDIDALQMLR